MPWPNCTGQSRLRQENQTQTKHCPVAYCRQETVAAGNAETSTTEHTLGEQVLRSTWVKEGPDRDRAKIEGRWYPSGSSPE